MACREERGGCVHVLCIDFHVQDGLALIALHAVKHLLSLGADASVTWEERAIATDEEAHALWRPWLAQRTLARLELAMENISLPTWRDLERHGPCGGSLYSLLHIAVSCYPILPDALCGGLSSPVACNALQLLAVQPPECCCAWLV